MHKLRSLFGVLAISALMVFGLATPISAGTMGGIKTVTVGGIPSPHSGCHWAQINYGQKLPIHVYESYDNHSGYIHGDVTEWSDVRGGYFCGYTYFRSAVWEEGFDVIFNLAVHIRAWCNGNYIGTQGDFAFTTDVLIVQSPRIDTSRCLNIGADNYGSYASNPPPGYGYQLSPSPAYPYANF